MRRIAGIVPLVFFLGCRLASASVDEFVGPFPSWADVKKDYGAVGDGQTDDTAALQKAFDALGNEGKPCVLYLPRGTYRITQTLTMAKRLGISIIGEDPSNTVIRWDGANDTAMTWFNGVAYSSFGRITWDGAGKALAAVDHGWADWYPHSMLRAFSNLNVPKKALIGPWSHTWADEAIPGPRIDDLRECEKWFDQWLKGVDAGVREEPRVTLFVQKYVQPDIVHIVDNGFWRSENEWPLERRQETPFYLRANGALNTTPCDAAEEEHDDYEYDPTVGFWSGRHGGGCFWPFGMPLDQRPDEALSLTYTTEPLQEDLEVIGAPRARLHVASTADITAFAVKLCDVAPDGISALVTRGYLNATCRESRTQPSLLEPGRIYELEIDLLSCAYVFQAGHRIRVTIASADFPNAWPTPKPCVNSIYRGTQRPSMVLLPVIPPQDPELIAPNLHPSEYPLPPREALAKPEYTLTHDLINGTATASYKARSGAGVNVASYTVSKKNPAKAVIMATYEYVNKRPDAQIRIETQCILSSDESAFHHMEQVEVKVNGKLHFNKSWSTSVPREFM